MTLEFIFRLVLCNGSREIVPFDIICLIVLEGIKQLYLLMWFKKYRVETPFKDNNVKALIKRQILKPWSVSSQRKISELQYLVFFFDV